MPERFINRITKLLMRPDYEPAKERTLAGNLGVADSDYEVFKQAIKQLVADGTVEYGPGKVVRFPDMPRRVVGTFQATSRGFGFVRPEQPTAQGDLFIPQGKALDAVDGDRVVARARSQGTRAGMTRYTGQITEILSRKLTQVVGTVQRDGQQWYVVPDGDQFKTSVFVGDVSAKNVKKGDKVLVEIIDYPSERSFASGVILEKIGRAGAASAELKAILLRYELPEKFSRKAQQEAASQARGYLQRSHDLSKLLKETHREDIRSTTVITIDPADAKDFDDAISLTMTEKNHWLLGVHIADVSHFVQVGSHLDDEAQQRGNSAYLPQKVIPMLPETLSNGVCSLQEGQPRFAKSAYIELDPKGKVVSTRFANSLIESTKRLTYEDADCIMEDKPTDFTPSVIVLVKQMEKLARVLQRRRYADGMLTLRIPRAELIYDQKGHAVDARPESNTFSHTMIEMFMLEANEAVGRLLDGLNVPFLRRVHAEPDSLAVKESGRIVQLCGYTVPKKFDRHGIQSMLERVAGKPEEFMINLAVLKSLQRAEYSPAPMGHFALASPQYCHFTSPIRRYPDLTIHRLFDDYVRGKLSVGKDALLDFGQLQELGQHCSETERNAEAAERDLTEFKVLQLLAKEHVGQVTDGVVTAVTNFGLFVQIDNYLIEGLIRAEDAVKRESKKGKGQGKEKGRRAKPTKQGGGKFSDTCPFKMGESLKVKLVDINLAQRSLTLVPA